MTEHSVQRDAAAAANISAGQTAVCYPAPAPAYRDNIDIDEYWTLDRVIAIRRRYVQDIPCKSSPIVILLIIFHKTSHRFLSIVSKNVTYDIIHAWDTQQDKSGAKVDAANPII